MPRREWKSTAIYIGLLAGALAVGYLGATYFGLDDTAYDFMMRHHPVHAWKPQSVILAIDEQTLHTFGNTGIRSALAKVLPTVASAGPKAVVIDIILADKGDPKVDAALAQALCATPNLVLSADVTDTGWDAPPKQFTDCGHPVAVGHVHAAPTRNDSVTRAIPLAKQWEHRRFWAISLEALRLIRGDIVESNQPSEPLMVGDQPIPIPDTRGETKDDPGNGRLMRIQFPPAEMEIPRVSMEGVIENPSLANQLTGKVVFIGVTAITELHDRLITPTSITRQISGIELHATAFETLANGLFLTDVSDQVQFLVCVAFAIAIGLAFRYLPGWWAYSGGVVVLAASMLVPYWFFANRVVFRFSVSVSVAWATFLAAAAYYHLVVRRNWHIERASRTRYQQAMQFVTHEMRTPLSAIQGSSELITRFPLTEEKRKQVAQLINSESKRLARMVEVFLNVERLSAGQMELKRENIEVKEMMDVCMERTRPLAARKQIELAIKPIAPDLLLSGDRELMEYACYNLLTNAVKYSPRETTVTVSAGGRDGHVHIAVQDQGMGMDQKEVRQIFQKFYRTKRAEASGEAGTGIGLSIVQEIVAQHGGHIDVVSQPGAGSCFTLVMPAVVVERS